MLTWVGLGLGVLHLRPGLQSKTPGEKIFKIFAGVVWLAVAVICVVSRHRCCQHALPIPDIAPAATAPLTGPS